MSLGQGTNNDHSISKNYSYPVCVCLFVFLKTISHYRSLMVRDSDTRKANMYFYLQLYRSIFLQWYKTLLNTK